MVRHFLWFHLQFSALLQLFFKTGMSDKLCTDTQTLGLTMFNLSILTL